MLKDLEDENRTLRDHIRRLTDNARANHAALQSMRGHEKTLLDADSLNIFLDACTNGTARHFNLSTVSLALQDTTQELRRLFTDVGAYSEEVKPFNIAFTPRLSELSPAFKAPSAKVYTGPYHEAVHRRLFQTEPQPQSVALIPFRRDRRQTQPINGVLNLASPEPQRFSPQQNTDFLQHLGFIVGVCLETALDRIRLEHSSDTDGLTGCHNRRYLQQRLLQEIAGAQRKQHNLCCILFDIDYFKSINDTYGHLAGDQVLIEFAQRLRRQLRLNDVFARYGGEEFAALLPETSINDALTLAERMREKIREPMLLDSGTLTVTVSAGVCEYIPQAVDTLSSPETLGKNLLNAADEALYQAKATGRNRVVRAAAVRDQAATSEDAN